MFKLHFLIIWMEKVHAEFFSIIMKVLKDTPYLDIDSFLIYFEMKINNLFCEMRSIILKFPLFCLDVSWRSSDKYWYREANIDDKFRQAAKIWIAYNSYRMHSLKVSLTFWISTRLECFRIMHINGSSKGAFLTFFFFSRFPEKIGGNIPGVHYIRDVADADLLVSSLVISFSCFCCQFPFDFVLLKYANE